MLDRSRLLRPTATADDIRQFREAVAAALKASRSDSPPAPDPEWRQSWPAFAGLGVTSFCRQLVGLPRA